MMLTEFRSQMNRFKIRTAPVVVPMLSGNVSDFTLNPGESVSSLYDWLVQIYSRPDS